MAPLSVLALVVFFSPATKQLKIILGDPAKLSADKNCTGSFNLKTQDGSVVVAALVSGTWEAQGHHNYRIEHHTTSSVVLTGVTYNDQGDYEFFCGTEVVNVVRLGILVPDDESVVEGEQLRLKCYFQNTRTSVKSMRWETTGTDGELVLELKRGSSEQPQYGTGFTGRNLSVSPEWHSTGDLSLTIDEVTARDEGVYVCSIHDEDGEEWRGVPAAVRVRVTKRNPDQMPTECPTQKPPEENGMSSGVIIVIGVLAVGSLVIAFGSHPADQMSQVQPGLKALMCRKLSLR